MRKKRKKRKKKTNKQTNKMARCLYLLLLLLLGVASATTFLNHTLVLDASGSILPWLPLPLGAAYETFVERSADWFIHAMPVDPATGMPIYYTHGQVLER